MSAHSAQLLSEAIRLAALPSITTWTRIEPLPREGSMQRSLQAQMRDPVWLLARQWQVGEFLGDDAGSPIQATMGVELRTITTYRPGLADAKTAAIDPTVPLEVHVEREPPAPRLRGSLQFGLYFENLIRNGGVPSAATVIGAFRQAFPISGSAPDPTYAPPDALRFRSIAAGRVTDGEALYQSAKAVANGQTPAVPLPTVAADLTVAPLLKNFVAYRDSIFSQPEQDSAWQSGTLDFAFALGSPAAAPAQSLTLEADDFPGGRLDWYSFDLNTAVTNATGANPSAPVNSVAAANPAQITPVSFDFLPNHVVFRGMPDSRWWNFEDGITDFGQLEADQVDLAKLLVMEFALVYGNDWFSIPVPITVGISGADPSPKGTLSRVTTLIVTDSFGVRTLIRPSEQTTLTPGETPWSMFKLSGPGTRSDFIVMAPTLGVVDDADALEQVLFLRDDIAALAWAVEDRLQGDLDAAVNPHEMYLARLVANPAPNPPTATTDGPQIYYTMETPVPDYWIPMVPVETPQNALYLRRGTMEIPTSSGLMKIQARAEILEPQHPFFVADHVVPRSGVQVERYFRRTRSSDGTTFLWLARKSGLGRGPGWSGLRFDIVRDMANKQ
jgi:hypothetical protein